MGGTEPSNVRAHRVTAIITRTKGIAPRVTRLPARRTLAPSTPRGVPLRDVMRPSAGRRSVRCVRPASPATRSNVTTRRTRSARLAISAPGPTALRVAREDAVSRRAGDAGALWTGGFTGGHRRRSTGAGHSNLRRHLHAGSGPEAVDR